MGEWVKIDNGMEHLKNRFDKKDLKFNNSVEERKRKKEFTMLL